MPKKRVSLSDHDEWERAMASRQDAALAAATAAAAAAATQAASQAETLARIDERVRTLTEGVAELVSRAEFRPVQAISYGLVGLILTGVVGALLATVISRGGP